MGKARSLKLKYDAEKSLSNLIGSLLHQASESPTRVSHTIYLGTVLKHLVGAMLELIVEERGVEIEHHTVSSTGGYAGRQADFVIQQKAIHVTVQPTQELVKRCEVNMAYGYFPIIVTLDEKIRHAQVFAEAGALQGRIEILSAETFLAANLHELDIINDVESRVTIGKLVQTYNSIIQAYETDSSLMIKLEP